MKYVETVESSRDKDVKVALIKISKEEIKLLYDLTKDANSKIPKTFETLQLKGRLVNIERELGKTLGVLGWHPYNHEQMKLKKYKI